MRRQLHTVTLGQLRDIVQDAVEEFGEDMPVAFSSNYGDYHRTEQINVIDGQTKLVTAEESAYSVSGWAVPREEDIDEDDKDDKDIEDQVTVCILT